MSIIKSVKSSLFGNLNMEIYNSAQEMADDLLKRKKTDSHFKDDEYEDKKWVGATREETYRMLREGYQPTVDAVKGNIKTNASGIEKRFKQHNDIQGFAPIVPNAILGLPFSMVNSSIKPIKTKVIDIYYELTVTCNIESDDLIKAGQKMLGAIVELEHRGYRFNLYVIQDYGDGTGCDMVCVKIKSANQPFDLKRMSFPTTHTAFFRGIGFEWYSKFPIGKHRFGYGRPVTSDHDHGEVQEEFSKLFGKGAVFFSATELVREKDNADKYVKEALTNDRVQG